MDKRAARHAKDASDQELSKPAHENGASKTLFGYPVPYAIVVLCLILAEGIYLIVSRPAMRIVVLVFLASLLVVSIAVWARLRGHEEDADNVFVQRIFPVAFLILGVAFLLFFPPRGVPDEDYHFGISYSYANLLDPTYGETDIRKEDDLLIRDSTLFSRDVKADYWFKLQEQGVSLFAQNGEKIPYEFDGTVQDRAIVRPIELASNPPQVKLASAVGILLGRALNLSGIVTFYLGRLFNFLFAFVLIVLAIRIIPIGKNIMMAVALLPMTLHVMGSYSYDAGIIGLAFLLIALLVRMLSLDQMTSRSNLVATGAVAVLLAPCKMLYAPICLLALCVPTKRFSSKREMLIWKVAMLLLPLCFIGLLRMASIASAASTSASTGGLSVRYGNEKGTYYTIKDVMLRPFHTAYVLLRTFYESIDFYFTTTIGGALASFQGELYAKNVQVFAYALVLGLSVIPSADDGKMLKRSQRLVCLLIFAISVVGVLLALMVSWTFVTENSIVGVQGRYFLPVLPLLLFAMRGNSIVAKVKSAPLIVMAMGGLNLLYLAQIYYTVLGGAM